MCFFHRIQCNICEEVNAGKLAECFYQYGIFFPLSIMNLHACNNAQGIGGLEFKSVF